MCWLAISAGSKGPRFSGAVGVVAVVSVCSSSLTEPGPIIVARTCSAAVRLAAPVNRLAPMRPVTVKELRDTDQRDLQGLLAALDVFHP